MRPGFERRHLSYSCNMILPAMLDEPHGEVEELSSDCFEINRIIYREIQNCCRSTYKAKGIIKREACPMI